MSDNWTKERVDEMLKLANEGQSALHIAQKLGGVSRSAVIGKLRRLGAPSLHPGNKKPLPIEELIAEQPDDPNAALLGNTKQAENTCKWPLGDPTSEDFHFCGKPAQKGDSYCEEHKTKAYVCKKERKRLDKILLKPRY